MLDGRIAIRVVQSVLDGRGAEDTVVDTEAIVKIADGYELLSVFLR